MDRSPEPRSRRLPIAVSVLLCALAAAIVFHSGAVPGPVPSGGPPTTYPANPHRLVTNNLKIGDVVRLDLFTLPQGAVWVLASSNSGPSYIGNYFTDLGPDWFVLHGPALMGGGSALQLAFPVPWDPGLVGLEFVVQGAVVSPLLSDVAFSNSVGLRASQHGAGLNILILRQTASTAGMANAAAQADGLALALQSLGNQVVVANDALPVQILDYDCILDLRFTLAPAADEAARFVQFLKSCGGVFFVAGPYAGSPAGQQRAAWIDAFLNSTLGIPVSVSTGGTLSNGSVETIDPSSNPPFANASYSIGGLPFDVSNEGGNFGPPGVAFTGTAWLTGNTVFGPLVFGIFFDPNVMPLQTVGGRVAVLFAGGASTFLPTTASPYPHLVMTNVAWYLDR